MKRDSTLNKDYNCYEVPTWRIIFVCFDVTCRPYSSAYIVLKINKLYNLPTSLPNTYTHLNFLLVSSALKNYFSKADAIDE